MFKPTKEELDGFLYLIDRVDKFEACTESLDGSGREITTRRFGKELSVESCWTLQGEKVFRVSFGTEDWSDFDFVVSVTDHPDLFLKLHEKMCEAYDWEYEHLQPEKFKEFLEEWGTSKED